MDDTEYMRLDRGDGIVVRFGRTGSQYALVSHFTASGKLMVRKWRAASGRWTAPVWVVSSEVLRRAIVGEYKPSVRVVL